MTPAVPTLNVASAQEMARKQFKEAADSFTVERRLQVCRICPHLLNSICHRCGCHLVGKVGQRHESCPIRRW